MIGVLVFTFQRRISVSGEQHMKRGSGNDAQKRISPPQLERHRQRSGRVRAQGPPFESAVRIYHERRDDYGRDYASKFLYPCRQGSGFAGEKDEGQRSERVGDGPADGDDSEQIYAPVSVHAREIL